MNRSFKWIWIPKEIWLNNNLSTQEKIMLAEIYSLEWKKWCFASNAYFAKFFSITERWVQLILAKLKEKLIISVEIEKWGNRIIKTKLENLNSYSEEDEGLFVEEWTVVHTYNIIDNIDYKSFGQIKKKNEEINTDLKDVSLEEIIDLWNSIDWFCRYNWRDGTKAKEDLKILWKSIQRNYYKEDINKWIENYIKEIKSRQPNTWYYNHRFPLYEFLKQGNGLRKFCSM